MPIHKDFHPGHVLLGDDVCVIDLDEARRGDPTFDVAHFCAYLELLSTARRRRAARTAFLEEYAAATGWPDRRHLPLVLRLHLAQDRQAVRGRERSVPDASRPSGATGTRHVALARGCAMPGRVIYIVRSWPRLSQTFIVNEVLALERRGLELVVFSLVRSGEDWSSRRWRDVRAPVHYLDGPDAARRPDAAGSCPGASPRPCAPSSCCCTASAVRGLAAGYGECSTLRCLGARGAASRRRSRTCARAGDEPVHVHAHFAHDPALVGMLVARLTGLPFSFTAHARDLYQIPAREPERPGRGRDRGGDLLRRRTPTTSSRSCRDRTAPAGAA